MLITGQAAPDFTLPDGNNKQISLSDFKGRQVVIYFYPKDDTPGCTIQACAFRNAYSGFVTSDVPVIGISRDSVEAHHQFAEKYQLPFMLLSDKAGKVIEAYDVKGVFGAKRTTYIVNKEGLIQMVFEKASPDTNASEILEYLNK